MDGDGERYGGGSDAADTDTEDEDEEQTMTHAAVRSLRQHRPVGTKFLSYRCFTAVLVSTTLIPLPPANPATMCVALKRGHP